jgi:tetratricopeptide (TPR) repeat protein
MSSFSPLKIVACLLVLMLLVSTAEAEYKRDYTLAKKSFEDGDYAEAISKLKDAIADNPESNERVKIYGMRYDSYIPHYFLGESYFKMNDCASAMAAWNKALQVGVIQGLDEYSSMQKNMAACKVDTVDVSKIASTARSEIDALETANQSFAKLQNESLLKQEWASKWQPELTRSESLVQTLRQRLEKATTDSNPDAIEAVISEAKNAVNALSGTEKLAQAQVKAIRSQGAEAERLARENARRELQNATRMARAAETYDGGNSQMTSLMADLQRQISVGESLGETASSANINEQTQVISNVLRRYNLAVQDWQAQKQSIAERTPPADLKRVAEAYFDGDYESAVKLAAPDSFKKDRAKIQALLFRAAANYTLYVRSGEQQQAILSQVQSDIRTIKKMNSRFSQYIAAFSPRFLALFKQTS